MTSALRKDASDSGLEWIPPTSRLPVAHYGPGITSGGIFGGARRVPDCASYPGRRRYRWARRSSTGHDPGATRRTSNTASSSTDGTQFSGYVNHYLIVFETLVSTRHLQQTANPTGPTLVGSRPRSDGALEADPSAGSPSDDRRQRGRGKCRS